MRKSIILSIGVVSIFCSCHSVKKMQKIVEVKDTATTIINLPPTDHAKEDSVAFIKGVYKAIQDNHISFTTFSGKIDLDYEDADGKKYNVNAHIRMYKDSVIWLSVTGPLGIEGLRAYITSDSVKLQDKQNKTYTTKSISFLQEASGLPLNLSTLQDLLLGNPVFLDSNITSYSIKGNMVSLQSEGTFFRNLFIIGEPDRLTQSSKLEDMDKQNTRSCYLTYSDYENKQDTRFATKRSINVVEKKRLGIKMDFKQYTFNEKLSFPFTVPKNYTQN